jgi:pSer/pThr/pTyr-binding forkhead associated (FHA) protein
MAELVLELVEGKEAGRTFELAGEAVAGRDPSQPIALGDEQVSRKHARFGVAGGTVTVEDLGSRNGTYVNGQILTGARALAPGDQVRMGLSVLQLRSREQVIAQPSAVRPTPDITAVDDDVLRPAAEAELAPEPAGEPASESQGAPGLRAAEVEPAFVPDAIRVAGPDGATGREGYDALASLVDSRVKRQTNVAAFALLAVAALAVIIFLALTL